MHCQAGRKVPGLGGVWEADLGAHAPTGSPQVDAGSHHTGPGGILFQHRLGQGWALGTAAVHGGAAALVQSVESGRRAADHPSRSHQGSQTQAASPVGDVLTLSRQELQ